MPSHRARHRAYRERERENEAESEDTEEASESEMGSSNSRHVVYDRLEIKEQMYHDKLDSLLTQLELLKKRKNPEYLRTVELLEMERDERLMLNECHRDYMLACAERDCFLEKAAAEKEYEEKKAELKENLISDLEDRKKMIEHEFATMELSGDSVDVKPTVTRKLRRRPNEPLPVPEKRRKPTNGQLVFLLEDKEIEQDLKLISRSKPSGRSQHSANGGAGPSGSGSSGAAATSHHAGSNSDQNGSTSENHCQPSTSEQRSQGQSQQQQPSETRIEDGKLWFERRWYHRGQPVHVEGRDLPRFAANISAIAVDTICVKKTSDGQKVRICLSHLRRGKVSIKRRAN